MKKQYGSLIIKQFQNLDDCLITARECLNRPIEWLEFLSTLPQYSDKDKLKRNLSELDDIDGRIYIAKLRVDRFKKKAVKLFEKKYKVNIQE